MRTLGNVLWFVLAGFWLFLGYVAAGVVACILVITIPFGIAAFRLANFVVWPFGRMAVRKPSSGAGSVVGNILWLVLFGWELALAHLVTGALLCLTIIGIPLGLANFKMIGLSLWPLGREIVPVDVADQRFGMAGTSPTGPSHQP